MQIKKQSHLPPIINAAVTTVTTRTKNLFVEVTGINKEDAEDMLSVVATILQSAGFTLESVYKYLEQQNSSPKLEEKNNDRQFFFNQSNSWFES